MRATIAYGGAPCVRPRGRKRWLAVVQGLNSLLCSSSERARGTEAHYSGSAGLLWAVNGGRLVELHRDWAVIDVPVNRSQRIFYRRNVDAAKIRLPWTRSGGSQ